MLDNKRAVVLLVLTLLNEMLLIGCQEEIDCTGYDLRKPPRFGKRSSKDFNPCDAPNAYEAALSKKSSILSPYSDFWELFVNKLVSDKKKTKNERFRKRDQIDY